MLGWLLVGATAAAYETWAEFTHHQTLTHAIRSLPWGVRGAVLLLGFALLVHLIIPTTWEDPVDKLEHRVHDLSHK